jgi:hypothetical protein
MKRLLATLFAASGLALLGGCATGPGYRYTTTTGGGAYYSGESAYGNADTVIYGRSYTSPWGYGPGWGYGPYGPGWGWGGIGLGATYTFHPHHHRRYYRPRHAHHRSPHRHPRYRQHTRPSH